MPPLRTAFRAVPDVGKKCMKELIFYLIIAATALFILGYSVHMLVGGLVAPETERWLVTAACLIGVSVLGLMAWDVARRRARGQRK